MKIIRLFPSEHTSLASSVVESAVGLGVQDIAARDPEFAPEVPRLRVLPAPPRLRPTRTLAYVRYQQGHRWEALAFILLAGAGLLGVIFSLVIAFHH